MARCLIVAAQSLSLVQDTEAIIEGGLWRGYNGFVLLIIVLQAITGLVSRAAPHLCVPRSDLRVLQVVALVVKYADNIHKGFANSASIIVSNTIDAYVFHDTDINLTYTYGSLLVVASCWAFASLSSPSQSHGAAVNGSGDSSAGTADASTGDGGAHAVLSSGAEDDVESHDSRSKGAGNIYSRWWVPWTAKNSV